ncbi:MAG: hypothetical protein ACKO4K_05810 [Flavobacteriales bacterium]
MKNLILFLSLLLISVIPHRMVGQTNCGNLSITTIYPDSLTQGNYWIGIAFSGSANQFISYPHVSSVLNCQGDTLATGNLFYFAQMGQTSQDYPVGTTNAVWCEPLTIQFIYGDSLLVNDTCYFTYGLAKTFTTHDDHLPLLFPNPIEEAFQVIVPSDYIGESYILVDAFGTILEHQVVIEKAFTMERMKHPGGVYYLCFPEKAKRLRVVFL